MKSESTLSPLLSPRELASILNVKTGTIYSWLSRGVDLPPSIKIGGSTRWRSEMVEKWILKKESTKQRGNFED